MSIRLTVKYKFRAAVSMWRMVWHSLALPTWLTGRASRIVLGAVVMIMAVAYAVQINSLSTSGYAIHSLEKQISGLESELQTMNTDIAAAQSLTNIQKRIAGLNLTPGNGAPQLKPTGDVAVAQR